MPFETPSSPVQPFTPRRIAVVGGGITGLSAAYRLTRLGHRVRLFESALNVGGVIRSEREGDWLVEAGPNSFLENSSLVSALISDLGLASQRVVANPESRNRYLVRHGQLRAAPLSPPQLFRTRLFSARSKLRLLRELWQRPRPRADDVSLAEFFRGHFGQEIVDVALDPFVSGVYAGDPEKLSARYAFPKLWENEQTHGSLIRGQIAQAKARRARGEPKPRVISFREGLQMLPDALAAALPKGTIEREARVHTLHSGAEWKLSWSRSGEIATEAFDRVILTLPSFSLAQVGIQSDSSGPSRVLAALDTIEYAPIAALFLGFRREQVRHPLDGFGALVPSVERRNILGILFSSTLFPRRTPEDHVALTVMVGGVRRPEMTRLSPAELLQHVLPELNALLGVSGPPVFMRHHAYSRAIPQYNLGHDRFLDVIRDAEARHPGLFLGGQIRDGIALPSCVEAGLALAEKAAR
jgi:oxygen-dependent protoporphyrinogen oxidase